MIKSLILGILLATGTTYAEIGGTYHCKNSDSSLNDNTIQIQNIKLGQSEDITQPYIISKKYFRQVPGNPNSPIVESEIKGFPVVFSRSNRIVFQLAGLTLEFDGDQLGECRKQ